VVQAGAIHSTGKHPSKGWKIDGESVCVSLYHSDYLVKKIINTAMKTTNTGG